MEYFVTFVDGLDLYHKLVVYFILGILFTIIFVLFMKLLTEVADSWKDLKHTILDDTRGLNKKSDVITQIPDDFEASLVKVSNHFINYHKNKGVVLIIDHTLGKKIAQSWDHRWKRNKDVLGLTIKDRKLLKDQPCVFYARYKSSEWLDQIIKELSNPYLTNNK